jgi:signal transduction histidine kinase
VFKNLRTSTMLVALCAMFIAAVAATIYSLIVEKQIAIEFARKELAGSKYLVAVEDIYRVALSHEPFQPIASSGSAIDEASRALQRAQAASETRFQTDEIARELANSLREFRSSASTGSVAPALDVLDTARRLVLRIADDSNLTLDPDLDTYHLQDTITRKLPDFLGRLGELQSIARARSSETVTNEMKVRLGILDATLRSLVDDVRNNLAAVYRGNADGNLRRELDAAFSIMMHDTSTYLGEVSRSFAGDSGSALSGADQSLQYAAAMAATVRAWESAQSKLDELLEKRIAGLTNRMYLNLAIIGALAALSIVVAILTYRHTVVPLGQLERVASQVRATKNYGLRIDYSSKNEIGQLTAAFNDMLAELAANRERERAEQSELARVARLTSMGAMTAAIAHEINQPLAAIVANSGAGQRWLAKSPPDLHEVRTVLNSISADGHRASEVIGSVRGMFQKEGGPREQLDVNDVISRILVLVQGEIRKQRVAVRPNLNGGLPPVVGDRVQLQQVFLNLILNAVESMATVSDRERALVLASRPGDDATVLVSIQDSGVGIGSADPERIFDAFYSTKPQGMGMGLFICRSIIESHGGRLWASPSAPHGLTFHVMLPIHESKL